MLRLAICLLLCGLGFTAPAQDNTLHLKHLNLEGGLALGGYDPVSYFSGKALKGKKEHAAVYNGATYYFASGANKKMFEAAPEKYEPAFGGWCAYAMGASGEKVEVDPETFKIVGGRLYLFYNKFFINTLNKWNPEEEALNKKALANWAKRYR